VIVLRAARWSGRLVVLFVLACGLVTIGAFCNGLVFA